MADDFDPDELSCGDPDCPCGDDPDDDAGHGDTWTADYAWRAGQAARVETITAFSDRGLL